MNKNTKKFLITFFASAAFLFGFSDVRAENVGSISVCRIFVDQNSQVASVSSSLPQADFSISVSDNINLSNPVHTSSLNSTQFSPNQTIASLPANCTSVSVPLGIYYYSQENIQSSSSWTSKYNDQSSMQFTKLGEVYSYYTELFDNDPNNDILVNGNSDGKLVLSAQLPNRTLVIVDTFSNNQSKSQTQSLQCAQTLNTIVSDTNTLVDGHSAVAYGFIHDYWKATHIDGATWIWSSSQIEDPVATTSKTFTRNFNVTGSTTSATLTVAADDFYKLWVNGTKVAEVLNEGNVGDAYKDTYEIKNYLHAGDNQIVFEVINHGIAPATFIGPEFNPAGLLYKLDILKDICPLNTPPSISLNGQSLMNLIVGQNFTDPGAVANDNEDGNITGKIIKSGLVNTAIAGTYTLNYSVTDNGGLSASTTRTVIVSPAPSQISGQTCNLLPIDHFSGRYPVTRLLNNISTNSILTDGIGGEVDFVQTSNSINANSYVTPTIGNTNLAIGYGAGDHGTFQMVWDGVDHSATSTNYTGLGGVNLKADNKEKFSFNYQSDFADNKQVFVKITVYSNANNASSVTVPLYGAPFTVLTKDVKFSDFTTLLGNGADFSSVGAIIFDLDFTSRDGHDFLIGNIDVPCQTPPLMCEVPNLTSPLSATAKIGQFFSYTLTGTTTPATTTPIVFDVELSTLPSGLSFSTTTNTISGTPTVSGDFGITLVAKNICGGDTQTLYLKVQKDNPPTQCPLPQITSNLTLQATLGQAFSYTLTASSTSAVTFSIGTSTLPSDLSFSTTTNTISGTPTAIGTYNVNLMATNSCGSDNKVLVLTINNQSINIPNPICLLPDSISDTTVENVGNPSVPSEPTLQSILLANGYKNNVVTDQKQYQIWSLNKKSQTFEIEFMDSNSSVGSVFGYYLDGNKANFVPVFKTGSSDISGDYIQTPVAQKGGKFTLTVENSDNITFAIMTKGNGVFYLNSTKNSDSTDQNDHAVAYDAFKQGEALAGNFIIAFEDVPLLSTSDKDYNDLVVRVKEGNCSVPPPLSQSGKVTFCMLYGNNDNILATSSSNLPSGLFSLQFATSTTFATSTIQNKSWSPQSFLPNKKVITANNDGECVTYDNLPFGTYYYSSLSVSGSLWNTPKYSDQYNQPVNNVFDLYNYSGELFDSNPANDSSANLNADGKLILDSSKKEHTVIMYSTYNPAPQCTLPSVTSTLSASGKVGTLFSYTITGTGTFSVSTSTLPSGLSFSTTTNTISGTPTAIGTYNVNLIATNSCGSDNKVLVLNISSNDNQCLLPQITSNLTPQATLGQAFSYTLTASSTSAVTFSIGTSTLPSGLSFSTTTNTISGTPTVAGVFFIYFSATNSCGIVNDRVVITVNTPPGGGGGGCSGNCSTPNPTPITGGGNGPIIPNPKPKVTEPNACYYLFDYLKQGWDNNPVEVKKLQVFLRDIEGFNVQITGVYDDQTVTALNAFQIKYKDDILTPWGHTAPTSFTYITTKKKVNEIYCKKAFPVTGDQQTEIDAFRNFLLNLKNVGVVVDQSSGNSIPSETTTVLIPEVGLNISTISTSTEIKPDNLTTLAGLSTTTAGISRDLFASVIQSGKNLGNLASAIFAWPYDSIKSLFEKGDSKICKDNGTSCCCCGNDSNWLTWLLLLIIAVLLCQIYREKRLQRKLLEINKELEIAE